MAFYKPENPLGGLSGLLDSLSSIQQRIQASANPLGNLPNTLSGISHNLEWYSRLSEHSSVASKISQMLAPSHYLAEIINHSRVYKNPFEVSASINQITEPLRRLSQVARPLESMIKAFDLSSTALGTLDILQRHQDIFQKQQHFFDQFNRLTGSMILPDFRPVENLGGITNYDVLSAQTLEHLIEVNDGEEQANANLDNLSELVQSNRDLREEIGKVLQAVSKVYKQGKRRKVKKQELKSLSEQFTIFFHKTVLRGVMTLQQTHNLMQLLYFFAFGVLFEAAMEAKGAGLFNRAFGLEEKKEDSAPIKQVVHDTIFVTQDFVIRNTPMYLRKSAKTRKLGIILVNTRVVIIAQKPKWCLVEAMVSQYSKKNGMVEKVLHGWVMKKNLDYFQ